MMRYSFEFIFIIVRYLNDKRIKIKSFFKHLVGKLVYLALMSLPYLKDFHNKFAHILVNSKTPPGLVP